MVYIYFFKDSELLANDEIREEIKELMSNGLENLDVDELTALTTM